MVYLAQLLALGVLWKGTAAFQSIQHKSSTVGPGAPTSGMERVAQFGSSNPAIRTHHIGRSGRGRSTRLHIFERMSEGCVAAVVAAQEQAAKLQLAEVGTEVMMAGCINQPETKALDRTLQKYGLTWRQAQRTLAEMYEGSSSSDKGWLSGFRAAKDDDDRPFSSDLKQTFGRAGRLADQMGSPQVQPDHIFLALLEYQETKDGKSAATIENDFCKAGGWAVLVKMNTFDAETIAALEVCQTQLDNMLNHAGSSNERELVTGVGGSSDTPTLAECGIDLTQQARDGMLDPVFGRDQEIRSCLRTLIRRRKNNVCLIGEPGVGKVRGVLLGDCTCAD